MPSPTVPWCASASASSRRSATRRDSPLLNTCSGILRLISNRFPGSVDRSRPRPSLNSSSPSGVTSMRNPRSASVIATAESTTNAKTWSSTLAEPSARRPSSSAASCRRSPTDAVVVLSLVCGASPIRKVSSVWRPIRIRSPWASVTSVIGWSLTNVPARESRSRRRKSSPLRTIFACSREISALVNGRLLPWLRPRVKGSRSIPTIRPRPSASIISRRAPGIIPPNPAPVLP